jgi:FkbM family methyltransferase
VNRVFYGAGTVQMDVTGRALGAVTGANTPTTAALVHIPRTDVARATMFGADPVPGVVKTVTLYDDGACAQGVSVPAGSQAWVQPHDGSGQPWRVVLHPDPRADGPAELRDSRVANTILAHIHGALDMQIVTKPEATTAQIMLDDELPEQVLITRALAPGARVLELGGNIGRSTCVIASLLDDSSKLVVLETDPVSVASLYRNRVVNGFKYHVEAAALSAQPLMQKGWVTEPVPPSGVVPPGWARVHTVTLPQLVQRYGVAFYDTVVADCEGALASICREYPDFFRGVHTVVLENDFTKPGDKEFVDGAMRAQGLAPVVSESGGWGMHTAVFFQVWMRVTTPSAAFGSVPAVKYSPGW